MLLKFVKKVNLMLRVQSYFACIFMYTQLQVVMAAEEKCQRNLGGMTWTSAGVEGRQVIRVPG